MAKTIVIKQIGSPIRRPAKQRATLIGLGLNKMHKTRELEDTPSVRGMINSVSHMVEIVEEKGGGFLRRGRGLGADDGESIIPLCQPLP